MSKKLIASVTLTAFAMLAVPVAALQGSNSSTVLASSGRVLSQNGGGWAEGITEVNSGTRIRTASNGTAVVSLPGGSLVRLAPDSQVAFESISDKGVVVQLERGRVIGHAGASLQVLTDRTVTKASEGEFVVNTSASGTKLDVLTGNALLSSTDDHEVTYGGQEVDSDVASNPELRQTQVHKSGLIAQNNDDDQDGNNDNKDKGGADTGNGNGDGGDGGGGGNGGLTAGLIGGGALAIILAVALSGDNNNNPVPSPSTP